MYHKWQNFKYQVYLVDKKLDSMPNRVFEYYIEIMDDCAKRDDYSNYNWGQIDGDILLPIIGLFNHKQDYENFKEKYKKFVVKDEKEYKKLTELKRRK